jgi:hypothetical protein
VRRPTNTGWRISPAAVHSLNFTSATSLGFTQVVLPRSGTVSVIGFLSVMSGTSFSCTERNSQCRSRCRRGPHISSLFSHTANSSAPKYLRLPRGAVKPMITTSCSWLAFQPFTRALARVITTAGELGDDALLVGALGGFVGLDPLANDMRAVVQSALFGKILASSALRSSSVLPRRSLPSRG